MSLKPVLSLIHDWLWIFLAPVSGGQKTDCRMVGVLSETPLQTESWSVESRANFWVAQLWKISFGLSA